MADKRVVIGDDSALARALMRRALAPLQPQVVEAASGNAVIRALNRHRPDLLLLDVCMPGGDGLMVLRRIRADSEFHSLPVIMVTVEGGAEIRHLIDSLGVSAYFLKPFDPGALLSAARSVLEPGQTQLPLL